MAHARDHKSPLFERYARAGSFPATLLRQPHATVPAALMGSAVCPHRPNHPDDPHIPPWWTNTRPTRNPFSQSRRVIRATQDHLPGLVQPKSTDALLHPNAGPCPHPETEHAQSRFARVCPLCATYQSSASHPATEPAPAPNTRTQNSVMSYPFNCSRQLSAHLF